MADVLQRCDQMFHRSGKGVRSQAERALSTLKLQLLGRLPDPCATAVSQVCCTPAWPCWFSTAAVSSTHALSQPGALFLLAADVPLHLLLCLLGQCNGAAPCIGSLSQSCRAS